MTQSTLYDPAILQSMVTNTGVTVDQLSKYHKVLLIFLRHTGCIFCQEAIRDIFDIYPVMLQLNCVAVFVHMETPEFFSNYLTEFPNPLINQFLRVYDKDNLFADAFGVVNEVSLALGNVTRAVELYFTKGIKVKSVAARDGAIAARKPAVFLAENSKVVHEFRVAKAHERPDYLSVIIDPKCEGDGSEASATTFPQADEESIGLFSEITKEDINRMKKIMLNKTNPENFQCMPSLSPKSSKMQDTETLKDVYNVGLAMKDKIRRRYIKLYAARIFSTEVVLFWEAVEMGYKTIFDTEERSKKAQNIITQFFDPDSLHGINITNRSKKLVTDKLKEDGPELDLFENIIAELETGMLYDINAGFINSDLHAKMLSRQNDKKKSKIVDDCDTFSDLATN